MWTAEYAAQVLLDSPQLYWRCIETTGTAIADLSGNGNGGTTNFSPTLGATSPITADPTAKAITFSAASTQTITSSYSPFVTNSTRTFEFWAKRTSARVDYTIVDINGSGLTQLQIQANGDGPPYHVQWRTNGGTSPGTWNYVWPDNTGFHHCVLTWNDSTQVAELFIDGTSQGTQSSVAKYAENVQFGFTTSGQYFTGTACEIAVYTSILSAARVTAHYNAATKPRWQKRLSDLYVPAPPRMMAL